MKLIEAMKQLKDLARKAEDIRTKIQVNSSHLNVETPVYGDRQQDQVREWLQAHEDIVKKMSSLRLDIQRTNLQTMVPIEIGGRTVTKSIAEWIHRRRDLSKLDQTAWSMLTDKGLREGQMKDSMGAIMDVSIVRNFDPKERDDKLELYRSEPMTIDATLEVVNAVTDVVEAA